MGTTVFNNNLRTLGLLHVSHEQTDAINGPDYKQYIKILYLPAGYKLRVENEAQGNASRFEQVLTQYQRAPEVTRQRMYLDNQEQVMSSVSKVIVDQKGGNSLLYLPLDKLLSAAGAGNTAGTSATATVPAAVLPEVSDSVDRSRDAFRSRDREDR